jgi:hypothetical protein
MSRVARGSDSGGITPFVGAALLFTNIDVGTRSETDFSVPLRLGAEFSATPAARLVFEVDIRMGDSFRDNASVNVGVNAPF